MESGRIEMKRQDIIELFRLLRMYEQTNPARRKRETVLVKEELALKYLEMTGERIETAKNPRCGGRNRKFDKETDERIKAMVEEGTAYRRIAGEIGCSVGYIHKISKGSVHKSAM